MAVMVIIWATIIDLSGDEPIVLEREVKEV
jgi:hypothetical protein